MCKGGGGRVSGAAAAPAAEEERGFLYKKKVGCIFHIEAKKSSHSLFLSLAGGVKVSLILVNWRIPGWGPKVP